MSGFETPTLLSIYAVVSTCCLKGHGTRWLSCDRHSPKKLSSCWGYWGSKYEFINEQERLGLRFLSRISLLIILGLPGHTFYHVTPQGVHAHVCGTPWRGEKEPGMWSWVVGKRHGSVVCMWWQLVAVLLQEALPGQLKTPFARTSPPKQPYSLTRKLSVECLDK